MRIFYISKYFDVPSGAETGSRGFHICREFSRKGHEVVVFTTYPPHLFDPISLTRNFSVRTFESLLVVFVRTIKFDNRRSWARIISWIEFEAKVIFWLFRKNERPDVVIASSLSMLSILTALLLKIFYRCQVVFEVRDIWPLSLFEGGAYSPRSPLVRGLAWLEKFAYKRSDLIIGTMPMLEKHVKDVMPLHAPVRVCPMGVSEEHLASLEVLDSNIGSDIDNLFRDDCFKIGYAGSFGSSNALEYLFEAAALMQDKLDVQFVFVGDGNMKEELIRQYGGLKNVVIGRRLRKRDVAQFVSRCDLVTFSTHPSLVWAYGQSLNKVIDYMLSAKPIYGVYNGYDDMITRAGCGWLSQSHDVGRISSEILEIASLPREELAKMGERGRQWITEHRRYKTLAAYYEEMLFELIRTGDISLTKLR